MNVIVERILIFAAGGLAGGIGTFFAVKKKFEAKADKEIEELRNYYDNRGKTYEELQALGRIQEDLKEKMEEVDPADGESPAEDDYDEGGVLTKEHENAGDPYVIERVDYGSEPHYARQTLVYYTVDDILTLGEDQNEEEIQDFDEIKSMLGNVLSESGFMDDDASMRMFVRNDKRCTDYEIVKVFGSFYEGHPD